MADQWRFNHTFGKHEYIVGQGEFFVSAEDIVISTLLGSCVSVVLYDKSSGLGGLNHFLLPEKTSLSSGGESHRVAFEYNNSLIFTEYGRYGVQAMELLINDLIRKGARKSGLEAKVFGGGQVLPNHRSAELCVSRRNIDFAFTFLENEGIPVLSRDVGGSCSRRIFLFPPTFRVLVKTQEPANNNSSASLAYSGALPERSKITSRN